MAQDDRQSLEEALDAHFGTDVARRLGHLSLHPHSDLSVSRVCTNVGVFLNALRQWSFDFNDPENHISLEAKDLIHKLKTSAGHILEVLDGLVWEVTNWHAKNKTGEPIGEDGVFPLARKVKSLFDTPRVKSVLAELQYLEVTVNLINDVVKCAALQTAQEESRSGRRTEVNRRDVLRAKLYIRSVIMSHRVAQKYVQQRHAEEAMLWNEAQNDGSVSRGRSLPPRVELHESSIPGLQDDIDYNDDHQGAEQQTKLVDLLLEEWADFGLPVVSAEGTEIDQGMDEQATQATEEYQRERTFGPLPFRDPYPPRTGAPVVAPTTAPQAQRPGPPPPRVRQPSLHLDTTHIAAVGQQASAVQGSIVHWCIVIGSKRFLFENGQRMSDREIPEEQFEGYVFSHDNACTEIPKDLVSRDAIRAIGYAHAEVPAGQYRASWSIRTALHWDKVNDLVKLTKAMKSPTSSRAPQSGLYPPSANTQYATPVSANAPPFGFSPVDNRRQGPTQPSPVVPSAGGPHSRRFTSGADQERPSWPPQDNQQRPIAQRPGNYVQRSPQDIPYIPQPPYQRPSPPPLGPPHPNLYRSQTTGHAGGHAFAEPSNFPPPPVYNESQLVRQQPPAQNRQAPPQSRGGDRGDRGDRDRGDRDRDRDYDRERDRNRDRRRDRSRRRDRNSITNIPRQSIAISDSDSEEYTSSSSESPHRDYDRDHRRIRRLEAANKVALAKDVRRERDKRNRSAFAKTWGLVASGAALLEGLDAAF